MIIKTTSILGKRALLISGFAWLTALMPGVGAQSANQPAEPIPVSELGAKASAQYRGNGLSVSPTPDGARLHCAFQKLEGQVTTEGLWLTSTVEPQTGEKFRVMARAIGRESGMTTLPLRGSVTVADKLARCARRALVEEYSVSVDGVRQDFVVTERPAGEGALRVELSVVGAKAEALANGAQLVLDGSGRKIAYSRLRVVDAGGKDLPVRLEVTTEKQLAVLVEDTGASYPVRIDPTFSDADWISMGGLPGASGNVYATAVDVSGNLYIGGIFTNVGGISANRVARWSGNAWSALDSGVDNNAVFALAIEDVPFGPNVYVGGSFTNAGGVTASRVAVWNPYTGWSALGLGVNNAVYALAMLGSDLYAGGIFAEGVQMWKGGGWSSVGGGVSGGQFFPTVNALAVFNSELYVGGDFNFAGVNAVNYVAKWKPGTGWSALANGVSVGVSSIVNALAVSDSAVYVGGLFTSASGVSANRVVKWEPSGSTGTWSALGLGVSGTVQPQVFSLAVSGLDLYVGGQFGVAGSTAVSSVAKWNPATGWSALGSGVLNTPIVYALAVSGSDVYAGGAFNLADNSAANYVAKWHVNTWSALGSGVNNPVLALAVLNNELYVGGIFGSAGGNSASNIVKWTGSSWSALGSGVNGAVNALAALDTNLYVGGTFTTAGGSSANRVAKWNPVTGWSALGLGVSGGTAPAVNALAVSGTNLYVGGAFTTAGSGSANRVAKWDPNGSTWSALGLGVSGGSAPAVYALAVSDTNLYVGGAFTSAGGSGAANIGKWNGIAWSALGLGVNSEVHALAVSDTNLFVGGFFTTAGGGGATYVARWDSTAWWALGSGVNSAVWALAISGSDLYVGGFFTTAGGNPASRVAIWNGSDWSALGSGVDSTVYALALLESDLYVGGILTTAGGKPSVYLARANIGYSGPEIAVEQPVGTSLADGAASINFGYVTLGSSSAPKTFTITNRGIADLTGLAITEDGLHPGDFTVDALGATTLAPGASTTFAVTFTPAASGARSAAIHIANNDANENPFDITFTGSGPLAVQCAPNLSTNTLGCATSRTLSIPENLTPPSYSGGSGQPTLTVKFEGELADRALPTSLTFAIGVTNLVWTCTAGNETVSCTQQVTVVMGVNQPPTIVPVLPLPTLMVTNSAKLVNLTVSDAETATTSLSVSSSSGSLVTVTPPSGSPNGSGNYSLTVTAGSSTGIANITNIVTDGCGATKSNIFTVQVIQPPTISAIAGQSAVARSATVAFLTVPFRVTGSGTITLTNSQVLPSAVNLGGGIFFQITAQPVVFSGSGADRTVLLRYNIPTFSYLFSSYLFPTNVQVTLTNTDSTGLSASRTFNVRLVDAPDLDGISDSVEGQVPNLTGPGFGDGNGDGIQDSNQLHVASLLLAAVPPSYVTLATATGLRLVDVQAFTPPVPPPAGVSFPLGLLQFQLEGLATLGASVTVTQFFHATLPAGLTYYKYGPPSSGAPADYYPFTYAGPGTTGAEIIPAQNKIILHLKDGALGDNDWTENGVIIDPGGPALLSVEQFALSISLVSPTQAQISWPVAAGALVLKYTGSLVLPITWQPDIHPLVTNGPLKSVTVDLANGTRFYSLGMP